MSTDLKNSPPTESEAPPERPRLNLSATQVVASALAAVTATVAASYLGIAGTVIGAGVASVVTVIGNAVYGHSINRMRPGAVKAAQAPAPQPAGQRRWTHFLTACLGVFAGVLVVVTGVELVAGKPLTDVVRGTSGAGTTVLGTAGGTSKSTPTPTPVTVTVTPTVVTAIPTVTVTGSAVTSTVTPTTTTTATPSASTSTSTGATSTTSPTDTSAATPSSSPTPSAAAAESAG